MASELESESGRAELERAWERAPEAIRREVTVGIQKVDPDLFKEWMTRARMTAGGFRPSKVAAREPAYRERLDKALWAEPPSHHPSHSFAGRVLQLYFTVCQRQLNDAFMKAVTQAGLTEETGDAAKVSAILLTLGNADSNQADRFALYSASLRWMNPGWFKPALS